MLKRPRKLKRTLMRAVSTQPKRKPSKNKIKIKAQPSTPVSSDASKSFINRSDTVFVVGCGPSLKGFNFKSLTGHDIIAINSAVFDVPNPKYFITMDYTYLKKVKSMWSNLRNRPYLTKIFVVSMLGDVIEKEGRIKDKKFNITYDLSLFDAIIKSRQCNGIGFTFRDFRTGENSGYCALQLAVILGYTNIFLLGIDLAITNGITHYHSHYHGNFRFSAKLDKYLSNFRSGIKNVQINRPGVNIISCSKISKLNDFIKYVDINKVL